MSSELRWPGGRHLRAPQQSHNIRKHAYVYLSTDLFFLKSWDIFFFLLALIVRHLSLEGRFQNVFETALSSGRQQYVLLRICNKASALLSQPTHSGSACIRGHRHPPPRSALLQGAAGNWKGVLTTCQILLFDKNLKGIKVAVFKR